MKITMSSSQTPESPCGRTGYGDRVPDRLPAFFYCYCCFQPLSRAVWERGINQRIRGGGGGEEC